MPRVQRYWWVLLVVLSLVGAGRLGAASLFEASHRTLLQAPDPYPTSCGPGESWIGFDPVTKTPVFCDGGESGGTPTPLGSGTIDPTTLSTLPYASVRVLSLAPVDLADPPLIIDGVTLADEDRILLINQTAPAENGLYEYVVATPAFVRVADLNTSAELRHAPVYVREGDVYGGTHWQLTTPGPWTLGTTALTFAQVAGARTDVLTLTERAFTPPNPLPGQWALYTTIHGLFLRNEFGEVIGPLIAKTVLTAENEASAIFLGNAVGDGLQVWGENGVTYVRMLCGNELCPEIDWGNLGIMTFVEQANDPTETPPSGQRLLYAKGDGFYQKNAGGTISQIGSGAGSEDPIPITRSLTLGSPTLADSGQAQLYWPATVTLLRLACSVDSGTVSINLVERTEGSPNSGGTNTLASALVCDTDSQVTTSFADATIAGDVPYALLVTDITGDPTTLRVHLKAEVSSPSILSKSLVVLNPTTDASGKVQVYWPENVALNRVACSVDAGSVTVQLEERAEGTPNSAGTTSLTAALECLPGSATTTSFSDAAIAADVPHALTITAVSGAPTALRVHLRALTQ